MKRMNTKNDLHKTPVFDRDELHRTYSGAVSLLEFNTSIPLWMSNSAQRIESFKRFDYFCQKNSAARDRYNDSLSNTTSDSKNETEMR